MANQIDEIIGNTIKDRRESQGWSKYHLAELLQSVGLSNFHQTTINRVESGTRALRVAEIYGFATVLECNIYDLIPAEPDVPPRIVAFDEALDKASHYLRMAKRLGQCTEQEADHANED